MNLSDKAKTIHETLLFVNHMFKQPEMEAMLRGQWIDPQTAAERVEDALIDMPLIVEEMERQERLNRGVFR